MSGSVAWRVLVVLHGREKKPPPQKTDGKQKAKTRASSYVWL
jgi:hypothetical protein